MKGVKATVNLVLKTAHVGEFNFPSSMGYSLELKILMNTNTVGMKPQAISAEGDIVRFADGSSIKPIT